MKKNKRKIKIKLRMKVCEGFINDGKFELFLTKEFADLLEHFKEIK